MFPVGHCINCLNPKRRGILIQFVTNPDNLHTPNEHWCILRWLDKREVKQQEEVEMTGVRRKRSISEEEDTTCPELDLKLMKYHIMKLSGAGGLYNSAGSTVKVSNGSLLTNTTHYFR